MKMFFAGIAALAVFAPTQAQDGTPLIYDDLNRFSEALDAIDGGMDPTLAFEAYLDAGSPALDSYSERYDVSAESIAAAYESRPAYYRAVANLRPTLAEAEPDIQTAIGRLVQMTPTGMSVPVYFLVADQKAGGTPLLTQTDAGPRPVIAVALDMLGLSPQTDMSEFPTGTGGRAFVDDIPQVVVHEMAHIQQMRSQGGVENYLSVYQPGQGSMLAIAVREGCAEYATLLVSGQRLGDRHVYGEAHEAELWAAFEPVMDDAQFSIPGWFGGTHPDHPDWPPQIGYWLGAQMCEAFAVTGGDPDARLADMFTLYSPGQVHEIADAYRNGLANR